MAEDARSRRSAPRATALVLLGLVCGAAAATEPWWRQYEPEVGGDATVARGRSAGGGPRSARNHAVAQGLVHAIRNSPYTIDVNADNYWSGSEYLAAVPDRSAPYGGCSCRAYGGQTSSRTTLTIVLWALLAIVAWYTPVTYPYTLARSAGLPDWSAAYQNLMQGIRRWSPGLSELAALELVGSPAAGRAWRRRRAAPAAAASPLAALGRWVTAAVWPSSAGGSGGQRFQQRAGPYYSGGYEPHGCHCATDRRGRLPRLAERFLYNSYWIPLIGLCLLIAEESFWRITGAIQTDRVTVNGLVSRTGGLVDYVQSLLGRTEAAALRR
ncbi:hypothetical protein FJT64_026853 [Amphibalanus amphitrite]|uniref:Uncharacterized protein n=1 Tax=Amphibalanus amphitrite TaxID=1232801 RepID=A0A6A4VXJ6_AMPAM|nr:hypothetical protein FJT64_026853 [Amphibalanus amphitrite]